MITHGKTGQSREFHGTVGLWLDAQLSLVDVPSRDGAMGVIGVSDLVRLIYINLNPVTYK